MNIETVDVVIHPDGRVELKINGVKGSQCMNITAELERLLGGKLDRELTSDYYEQPTAEEERQKLGY